jgi:hypothetical protein
VGLSRPVWLRWPAAAWTASPLRGSSRPIARNRSMPLGSSSI